VNSRKQNIPINVYDGNREEHIRRIKDIAVARQNLSEAVATVGTAKDVFRLYLQAEVYKRPDDTLKTYAQMVDDLSGLITRKTAWRWLKEINPVLSANIAAAHPIPGRPEYGHQ